MPYVEHDAGKGRRGWDTGDCTVRALAVALGWSYTQAWDRLYYLQGKHKACSFKLAEFLRRDPEALQCVSYVPCKVVRGQKRMTGAQFCKLNPQGRYILRCAHHITVVVDGRLLDRWDCSKKCVYCAWKVEWRP